jgi:hypothetical protein
MEYQKIPNLFIRNLQGKLVNNDYSRPEFYYLAQNEWYATEKIDGMNIRVIYDGYRVSLKGRTDNSQIPNGILNTMYSFFKPYCEEVFEQNFGKKTVILFGEGYGKGIQNGSYYREDNGVILFDVSVDGKYLSRESVEEVAECFSLPVVPIVMEGSIESIVEYVKTRPKSIVAQTDSVMEGVVAMPWLRLYGNNNERIITKIKARDVAV